MAPERYKELMRDKLDHELYKHSLGVAEAAFELAERYQADKDQAYLAGIVHDYGKRFSGRELLKIADQLGLPLDPVTRRESRLLHAPVGAALLKKESIITDPKILRAVAYHTTGRSRMSRLEKVIYLADYIETGRDFPAADRIRRVAVENLEQALLEAVEFAIKSVLDRGLMLHPRSVAFRNELVALQRDRTGEKRSLIQND